MMIEVADLTVTKLVPLLRPCLAWCGNLIADQPQAAAPSKAFRSVELEMEAREVFPESCHTPFSVALENHFDAFLHKRSSLATSRFPARDSILAEATRDRSLLITDWQGSLFDGAVAPETEGFIDDDCMPPWDTWIALVKTEGSVGQACLLSWVPQWISDRVDFGIQADAAECLSWLRVASVDKPTLSGWGSRWAA